MPMIIALSLVAAAASPYQLSAAEVRQCAALKLDVRQRTAAVTQSDIDLKAAQAALAARQAALTAQASTVNTKNKKEVEAYNASSASFNADVVALRPKVEARNAANNAIPPLLASYNSTCSHRSMNPKDIAALPDDLRQVLTEGSSSSTVMVPAAPKPPRRR